MAQVYSHNEVSLYLVVGKFMRMTITVCLRSVVVVCGVVIALAAMAIPVGERPRVRARPSGVNVAARESLVLPGRSQFRSQVLVPGSEKCISREPASNEGEPA